MDIDSKSEYWSENFSKLDFSNIRISSKEFDGCTFTGCDFSGATFHHCNFVDCEFVSCNLSLVAIESSKFRDISFHESKLLGIDWSTASWSNLTVESPVRFYNCIINDSTFYGLTLRKLVAEQCKAHNVDFREGDFRQSNFTFTDLTGCQFSNTNLSAADFSEASNYDIDMHFCDIRQAKFSRFDAVRLLNCLDIELVD